MPQATERTFPSCFSYETEYRRRLTAWAWVDQPAPKNRFLFFLWEQCWTRATGTMGMAALGTILAVVRVEKYTQLAHSWELFDILTFDWHRERQVIWLFSVGIMRCSTIAWILHDELRNAFPEVRKKIKSSPYTRHTQIIRECHFYKPLVQGTLGMTTWVFIPPKYRVWRDQPRGKPKGAQPTRVFPEVDPDTQGQVNSMLRVRASVLSLITTEMTVTKHP